MMGSLYATLESVRHPPARASPRVGPHCSPPQPRARVAQFISAEGLCTAAVEKVDPDSPLASARAAWVDAVECKARVVAAAADNRASEADELRKEAREVTAAMMRRGGAQGVVRPPEPAMTPGHWLDHVDVCWLYAEGGARVEERLDARASARAQRGGQA